MTVGYAVSLGSRFLIRLFARMHALVKAWKTSMLIVLYDSVVKSVDF